MERSLLLPIPPFTNGILPTGIHDCDLNEIETVFVYNNRRQIVWRGFTSFLGVVRNIPEFDLVYVDGSFITDKELPNDVDVVLEVLDVATFFRILSVYPNLHNQAAIKQTYLVDLWFSFLQMPAGTNDLREFFQYVRPEDAMRRGLPAGAKKGLLRISLQS